MADPKEPKEPDQGQQKTEVAAPKRKAAAPKRKNIVMSEKEIAIKLNIIFALAAKLMGKKYEYKPADFDQEGAALARLAEKFEVVNKGLSVFDPAVIIAGLATKFVNMKADPEKKPKPAAAPADKNIQQPKPRSVEYPDNLVSL